ncbi:MAG: heavy metal translocating P-type ATPase [Kiloniellaceae bacterium]
MTAIGEALLPAVGSQETAASACSHCLLPVGRLGQQRIVNGQARHFCCYGCCIAYQVRHGVNEEHEAAWLLVRLGVGAFLAMNIMLFSLLLYSGSLGPEDGGLRQAVHVLLGVLATPVLVILGEPFLRGAWLAARQGRASADTLVSLGAVGAYGYSVYAVGAGTQAVYFDTVTMVLVLFTLGRYLEALGRARAMRSLAPMLAAESATAVVVEDGRDSVRPVQQIAAGTVVRLRPGERVAVDAVVIEGHSTCDESVLTGQPEARPKAPGSEVYAGSLNGNGQLLVRATATGAHTAWGRHARFVREALGRRSLAGELADHAAAIFVPVVVLLAGASVLYWSRHVPFGEALMTGLAVLVVACPCALGLAAPLATAIGLGRAAECGILLRGGGVLERLARIRTVAFDKTGTLTGGDMELVRCLPRRVSEAELLSHAAGLARGSDHPVARAILAAAEARGLASAPVQEVQALPGEGLIGVLAGERVALGSAAFMAHLTWPLEPAWVDQDASRSTVFVGWSGAVQGLFLLEEPPLNGARTVVAALARRGIASILLSGDRPAAAGRFAEAVGIGSWQGGLSPLAKVEALQVCSRDRGAAAMVGDGLNDGPVLAAADVGIAVGGATDLARETADVRLPPGRLDALPWLIDHGRRVRRRIFTNILWALGYNTIALTLAVCGLLQPIFAAGLMAGSSLFIVGKSLLADQAKSNRREGRIA